MKYVDGFHEIGLSECSVKGGEVRSCCSGHGAFRNGKKAVDDVDYASGECEILHLS